MVEYYSLPLRGRCTLTRLNMVTDSFQSYAWCHPLSDTYIIALIIDSFSAHLQSIALTAKLPFTLSCTRSCYLTLQCHTTRTPTVLPSAQDLFITTIMRAATSLKIINLHLPSTRFLKNRQQLSSTIMTTLLPIILPRTPQIPWIAGVHVSSYLAQSFQTTFTEL